MGVKLVVISELAFGLTIVVGFLFGLLVGLLMERAINSRTKKEESHY